MSAATRQLAMSTAESVLAGNTPGYRLCSQRSDQCVEAFVSISSGGIPRVLLPIPTRPMRAALQAYATGGFLPVVLPPLLGGLARTTLLNRWCGGRIELSSQSGEISPLRSYLTTLLQRGDFQLALRLSFGRPNAKTVITAIADSGDILCYAKAGSSAMSNALVRHEGQVLAKLRPGDFPVVLPELLHVGAWTDEITMLITRPLSMAPLDEDVAAVHKAADAIAVAHGVTSAPLAESDYWQRVLHRVGSCKPSVAEHYGIAPILTRITDTWGHRVIDMGASHGDWSRANVGVVAGRIAAVDWERYAEGCPRGIDTAHFAVLEQAVRLHARRAESSGLDFDKVVGNTRRYLSAAGRPVDDAELLIVCAILEMTLRFMDARDSNLPVNDTKFRTALQSAIQLWAN